MGVIVPITPFFRKKPKRRAAETPVEPLELLAATLQVTEWVDLTFSRAVSLVGGVGDATVVRVYDGDVGFEYAGESMSLVSPAVVRVMLTGLAEWMEPGVTLDVAAGSGIVAADDGQVWGGVTGVSLPFSS